MVALMPGDMGAFDRSSVNFLAGAHWVLAGALPLQAAALLVELAFFFAGGEVPGLILPWSSPFLEIKSVLEKSIISTLQLFIWKILI